MREPMYVDIHIVVRAKPFSKVPCKLRLNIFNNNRGYFREGGNTHIIGPIRNVSSTYLP